MPRLRGCVAVWGCAGSPPSGPLRGVAWALHGGGLGGRPLGRPFGRVAPPAVAPCGLCAPCLFGPSCGACLLPSPPFRSSHSSALSRTAAPPLARSRGAKSAPCWPRPSAPWLLDLRRFSGSAQNARKMRRKAEKMRKTARFDKKICRKGECPMTSKEARIIVNERRYIAAIIERNQQKLHNQMRGNSAEWSRWAIANQWLALEKQRLQILGKVDYREAGTLNFHAHEFPTAEEKPASPGPQLPNFEAVRSTTASAPKRGRRPKAASQPPASPSGAATPSLSQKGIKKAR